jgi:hypothetical protein
MAAGGSRRGHEVHPDLDDADLYGAGCSRPAVQAASGLTGARFQKRSQLFVGTYK